MILENKFQKIRQVSLYYMYQYGVELGDEIKKLQLLVSYTFKCRGVCRHL